MKKADIFRLSDGLLSFVTYEWVTVSLYIGAWTSYLTSSVGKLPLQIGGSADQRGSFVDDNGQPIAREYIGFMEVRERT